jgi:hypothetical protein
VTGGLPSSCLAYSLLLSPFKALLRCGSRLQQFLRDWLEGKGVKAALPLLLSMLLLLPAPTRGSIGGAILLPLLSTADTSLADLRELFTSRRKWNDLCKESEQAFSDLQRDQGRSLPVLERCEAQVRAAVSSALAGWLRIEADSAGGNRRHAEPLRSLAFDSGFERGEVQRLLKSLVEGMAAPARDNSLPPSSTINSGSSMVAPQQQQYAIAAAGQVEPQAPSAVAASLPAAAPAQPAASALQQPALTAAVPSSTPSEPPALPPTRTAPTQQATVGTSAQEAIALWEAGEGDEESRPSSLAEAKYLVLFQRDDWLQHCRAALKESAKQEVIKLRKRLGEMPLAWP